MSLPNRIRKILIILISLFPGVVPLVAFLLYDLPVDIEQNTIDLSTGWQYNQVISAEPATQDEEYAGWTDMQLPASYYSLDLDENQVRIRRSFDLPEGLQGTDLFLVFANIYSGVARVFVNSDQVGEIGMYDEEILHRSYMAKSGFRIRQSLLKKSNNVIYADIKWLAKDCAWNGITDSDIRIGRYRDLQPVYYRYMRYKSNFNGGILILGAFMIILLAIFILNKIYTEERHQYLHAINFSIAGIFYAFLYNGFMIPGDFAPGLINKLWDFSVVMIVHFLIEYVMYYFYRRTTRLTWAYRIFHSLVLAVSFFLQGSILETFWFIYMLTVMFTGIYLFILTIYHFIKNRMPLYNLVLAVSLGALITTGINDFLSLANVIQTPLVMSFGLLDLFSAVAFLIVAEFVDISNKNIVLADSLRKVYIDLSRLHQIEKEKNRLKLSNIELEQFAYVASHDLQEPLRKIIQFGKMMSNSKSESLDDKSRDYLGRMSSAARRMQNLINGLLSYSRLSANASSFIMVDLNEILEDVLSDLELRISESGAVINKEKLPVTQGDPLQLRQLFQNLIGNALKYQRSGNQPVVDITCRTIKNADIKTGQDCYEIVIKDNGIGFEQKNAEKIFTVFKRLVGRSEFEGTGIGLSVCKKVVEKHGGSIRALGKLNQGAEFIITLPSDS